MQRVRAETIVVRNALTNLPMVIRVVRLPRRRRRIDWISFLRPASVGKTEQLMRDMGDLLGWPQTIEAEVA